MAKTRRILPFLLLLAVLGTTSWLVLPPHDPEPVYNGKPLSYWCDQYPNRQLREQAEIAIRTIGTNAIPIFLRWLNAKDSKIKIKFIQFAQKQHLIDLKFRTAEIEQPEAVSGFTALGPRAKSAVPGLVKLYSEHHHGPCNDPVAIAGLFVLMGPAAADAVPQLSQDTTNTANITFSIRVNAVWALGEIHAQPGLAVPALTKALRDPAEYVRGNAAHSLGAFGPAAQSAVPELVNALADPSLYVRDEADHALKQINRDLAAQSHADPFTFKDFQ